MKAHLLFRDRDFDWQWGFRAAVERQATQRQWHYERPSGFDPMSGLPWNADTLTADLSLETLFAAMARDDDCIFVAVRRLLLSSPENDIETIRYRQAIVQDCLKQATVVRELYATSIAALEKVKGHYLGTMSRYPDYVLREGVDDISGFLEFLKKLRSIADQHQQAFVSDGWVAFFAMLQENLSDDYFDIVQHHLEDLRLKNGELLSAELGVADKGSRYMIHRVPYHQRTLHDWWEELVGDKSGSYSFEIDARDQAGIQVLGTIRDRGLAVAARAVGKSADHLRAFFSMLRMELAFYVGCLNLHETLATKGEPLCIPQVAAAGEKQLSFHGLYDIALSLSIQAKVVGNDVESEGTPLVVITGPNTGGKSTFLRSVGLAQLMLQGGMYVPAESYSGSLCDSLLTHFKKEEDVGMTSGKFDEELGRMSQIVDHLTPHAVILFNESFAATNEREGSEIAREIVTALLDRGARAFYVTHMYDLAHGFFEKSGGKALFLRAGREASGTRTFKLDVGEPLPTSYGEDLYNNIFLSRSGNDPTVPVRPEPTRAATAPSSQQSISSSEG